MDRIKVKTAPLQHGQAEGASVIDNHEDQERPSGRWMTAP
jgi:hypothetical protein